MLYQNRHHLSFRSLPCPLERLTSPSFFFSDFREIYLPSMRRAIEAAAQQPQTREAYLCCCVYQKKQKHGNLIVINHRLFIIIMATKSVKKIQVTVLRSSRRLKNKSQLPAQPMEPVESEAEGQDSDINNQIYMQNEQQLKLKPEKQSTSPPNHEGLILNNKSERHRRVTRSFSYISSRMNNEIDIQNQQITPEEHPINKIQEQDTSKKFSKSTSAQDCNEVQLSDFHLTNKKNAAKTSQVFNSPYTEFRKSYRKLPKREIISIPYRKCHDALEGRIVAILNKLEGGKNCLRDFDGLMEKMNKITSKDLKNRFIISGIKTIIAVSEQKNIYDPEIIEKLRVEEQRLQERLVLELDSIEQYENSHPLQMEPQNPQDYFQFKSLIVKKLYHNIKKKHPHCRGELKQRIFGECQRFFQGQFNMKLMIKFIRGKLEGMN